MNIEYRALNVKYWMNWNCWRGTRSPENILSLSYLLKYFYKTTEEYISSNDDKRTINYVLNKICHMLKIYMHKIFSSYLWLVKTYQIAF